MDCPICCESRGYNEFQYPACRHPVCHSCVTMLHGTYNGVGQPRCPTCRMELQDPVDAVTRQLLDERREWRLRLAEQQSQHEREMAAARRQWEEQYNRFEQRVHNDLARAYLDRVHFSRALCTYSNELFHEAFEQIQRDSERENIRPEWTPQASSIYVRLRNKYERFNWGNAVARGGEQVQQQVQPQPPPPPPVQPQEQVQPPPPVQPQEEVEQVQPLLQPPAAPSPLRAFFDDYTRRTRAGGVAGARMADERSVRRYANPYPMWTTKMRSRPNLS